MRKAIEKLIAENKTEICRIQRVENFSETVRVLLDQNEELQAILDSKEPTNN
jgi:predicted KAP-like P-loop ATPase